jgi:hypothetical protein
MEDLCESFNSVSVEDPLPGRTSDHWDVPDRDRVVQWEEFQARQYLINTCPVLFRVLYLLQSGCRLIATVPQACRCTPEEAHIALCKLGAEGLVIEPTPGYVSLALPCAAWQRDTELLHLFL